MERIPTTRPVAEILPAMSLVAVAGVLFLRRALGDVLGDIPAAESALYAALFTAAASFTFHRLGRMLPASIPAHAPRVLALLVSLVFAAGLAADPSDAFASLLAIAATLAIPILADSKKQNAPHSTIAKAPSGVDDAPPESGKIRVDELPSDDPNIAQSLTRRSIGSDCVVEGMLVFEIPAGETVHQLHVPFWPALPATPVVECEIDELDARVRVPLAAAHGLRIEVRVTETSEESRSGTLHFTAHAPASRTAA